MKLLKKLIPILTVASTTVVALPLTVSCFEDEPDNNESDSKMLKNKAFDVLSYYYAYAIQIQPEAKRKIEPINNQFYDYIFEEESGYKCYGAALLGGKAMESVARQPEAEDKIRKYMTNIFNKIQKSEEYKAIGYGHLGAKAAEGIARQPEAEGKITGAVELTIFYINGSKNFDQATGLGLVGASATEGIARQPEAEEKITKLLIIICNSIEKYDNDSVLEPTNFPWTVSLSLYDEFDEWGSLIWEPSIDLNVLQIGYNYSSGKAIDVGTIGAVAVGAIARWPEPEVEGKINKNVVHFLNMIDKCSDIEKTRFLGGYGAETTLGIYYRPYEACTTILSNILPSISIYYIEANLIRARDIETILKTFGKEFFMRWENIYDSQQWIESSATTVWEYIPNIVNINSDTKAHELSKLSVNFLMNVRSMSDSDTEEYMTLEQEYIKAVENIIK